MEISTDEIPQETTTISSNDVVETQIQLQNQVPEPLLNHEKKQSENQGSLPLLNCKIDALSMEYKPDITQAEVNGVLKLIASTGKFWLDWDKLKSMLSFQLKQILSDYPEAKMSCDDQKSKLGETFLELVQTLDEALCSFIEGPPFTLQRLCEILLSARSIYPNLSKLAQALEKKQEGCYYLAQNNLLVTSTLTMCTDPYLPSIQISEEPEKVNEEPEAHSSPIAVSNGVEEAVVGDGDEIMVEADTGEDMTIDMVEPSEEIVGISEATLPHSEI